MTDSRVRISQICQSSGMLFVRMMPIPTTAQAGIVLLCIQKTQLVSHVVLHGTK